MDGQWRSYLEDLRFYGFILYIYYINVMIQLSIYCHVSFKNDSLASLATQIENLYNFVSQEGEISKLPKTMEVTYFTLIKIFNFFLCSYNVFSIENIPSLLE
jgi:CRISPR/Cas system-associated protein endoribonuclease Cas2